MEKIAAVRNTYWDFLFSTGFNESHGGLAAVDFVVAVDSDMCRQWAPAGFAAAFGVPPPWAAVLSNGIAPPGTRSGYWFTDHLALQERPGTPVPWIRRDGIPTTSPERRSYKVIHPATAPFEVNSAFGGVGIYRAAAARGCRHVLSPVGMRAPLVPCVPAGRWRPAAPATEAHHRVARVAKRPAAKPSVRQGRLQALVAVRGEKRQRQQQQTRGKAQPQLTTAAHG